MKIIVGLGNPETDYSETRHNMGFNTINKLAKEYDIDVSRTKFDALYGTGIIENEKSILVKPQTYMNLSGKSVVQFVNFYKIDLQDLLVIYDDMDTEISKIRIRKSGSHGGHNGIKSLIDELSSEKFPRIRIGIGRPRSSEEFTEYVVGAIPEEEKEKLEEGVTKAKEAVKEILKNDINFAMNKFN